MGQPAKVDVEAPVPLKRSPTLASVNVGRNDLGADACAALLKAGAQSAGLFLSLIHI